MSKAATVALAVALLLAAAVALYAMTVMDLARCRTLRQQPSSEARVREPVPAPPAGIAIPKMICAPFLTLCRQRVGRFIAEANTLTSDWDEAFRRAEVLPRGTPMEEAFAPLRPIEKHINDLSVPYCAAPLKEAIRAGVATDLEVLRRFLWEKHAEDARYDPYSVRGRQPPHGTLRERLRSVTSSEPPEGVREAFERKVASMVGGTMSATIMLTWAQATGVGARITGCETGDDRSTCLLSLPALTQLVDRRVREYGSRKER